MREEKKPIWKEKPVSLTAFVVGAIAILASPSIFRVPAITLELGALYAASIVTIGIATLWGKG